MTVTVEVVKVYRGGGRRYLTKNAAINAEAVKIIKAKYPTEREYFENGYCVDPGFHWTSLPRSHVMLRRMCRLVKKHVTPKEPS
jgi:hypothetical protein